MSGLVGLVMAGGRGTRMAHAHPRVPKPLVRIAGLPLLEINLRQLVRAGIAKIHIAVHHEADMIIEWTRANFRVASVDVRFLVEERPRGTIGSLAELRDGGDAVLVCNGDLLSGIDLPALLAFHARERADLTIATHFEHHRLKLGEVEVDGTRVLGYREKPVKTYRISSGVYLWTPKALARVRTDDWEALPDLANRLVAEGLEVRAYQHDEPWLDVNEEADRVLAEEMLRNDPVAFGLDREMLQ